MSVGLFSEDLDRVMLKGNNEKDINKDHKYAKEAEEIILILKDIDLVSKGVVDIKYLEKSLDLITKKLNAKKYNADKVKEKEKEQKKLIKEIERLEKHALQLDNALALVLDNLYNVKKAKQQQDTNKIFGEE